MSAEPVHKITGFSALDGEELLAAIYSAPPESLGEDEDSGAADRIRQQARQLVVEERRNRPQLLESLLEQPMSNDDGSRFLALFLRAVALRPTQLSQEKRRVLAEIEALIASYSLAPNTLLAVEAWASSKLLVSSPYAVVRSGIQARYFRKESRYRDKRQPT